MSKIKFLPLLAAVLSITSCDTPTESQDYYDNSWTPGANAIEVLQPTVKNPQASLSALNKMRLVKEETRSLFTRYTEVPEDKKEFGNDLLDMYYVGMGVEDDRMLRETLKLLYEDGLIGLENIAYLEPKYIRPMFDKLSLDDAMKVKGSMSFETLTEMFDSIFMDPEFTDERRFIAVMNFFGDDTKEDGDAREFYLAMLDNDAKEKRVRSTGKKREKRQNI